MFASPAPDSPSYAFPIIPTFLHFLLRPYIFPSIALTYPY